MCFQSNSNRFGLLVANRLLLILCAVTSAFSAAVAQESFRPSDPFASVDGDPVYLGELNYLLSRKLRARDLSVVPIQVQQASSLMLVRQHLAMISLKEQGGAALQTMLDRSWQEFIGQLARQGTDLQEYCKRYQSNEQAVRSTTDWETAWRGYLKSRMTEDNLRRFYRSNAARFGGSKWNVSHIFIPIEDDLAGSESIAQMRVDSIRSRLDLVTDDPQQLASRFAEIAIAESDGATAREGGKIGWITQDGDLPRPLLDAIAKTQPGNVTEPVRSTMGFHLALVHEVTKNQIAYEQLTDVDRLRRDAANAMFANLVSRQSEARVNWYIKRLKPPTLENQNATSE